MEWVWRGTCEIKICGVLVKKLMWDLKKDGLTSPLSIKRDVNLVNTHFDEIKNNLYIYIYIGGGGEKKV